MTLLVDPGSTRRAPASATAGSPRWVAGILAALQGALLSLLAIVVPALGAYVATSADPANDGVEWFRSVRVGAAIWLSGHGVPPAVGGVRITFVPLGATLLAIFTCWASARRSGTATRAGLAAGTGAYAALVAVLALLTGAGAGGLLRGVAGAVAVAGLGLGLGAMARPEAPTWRSVVPGRVRRWPLAVRVGTGGAALALAGLVLIGAVVVLGWTAAGRPTVLAIAQSLGADPLGTVVLALANLLLVPNLVLWAVAWVAGPGFAVGAGTHFAPDGTVGGPLPAVPVLGILPEGAAGPLAAAPLVVVGIGVAVGWYVHRVLRRVPTGRRWFDAPLAAAVAALLAGVAVVALQLVAGGAAGPGRLAEVGAPAVLVGAAVALEVGLGALVVAAAADPVLRAGFRRRWAARRAARSGAAG